MNTKQGNANRAVRLTQIQHFLHQHPAGLTTRELSGLCNVSIRNIQRDLLLLQSDLHIPLERKSCDRYVISREYLLPPVAYSLYEALVLFLALRLLVRQTDESNPYMQSAVLKLISLMPVPLAAQMRQSVEFIGRKPLNTDEIGVFEKVSLAWGTRKRLRILYRSLLHGEKAREWYINPYFVEMTGVGFSTYLIGYAESGERMGICTFKLNRIEEAEIIDADFDVPHELNMDEMLSSAWGVIYGEEVQVKLRFSPAVTRRVKETRWHLSQKIEDLEDGGCVLTVRVGSTLEMTPWIRGWGPDVEVLEPLELREQFKGWAERLDRMYNQVA